MEKAMAPHSSTLAWKIPWAEEPGRLQSMGSLRVRQTEQLHFLFSPSCIGEGNGNPLLSCLENPRDGGAWWAAIYGVAQGRTQLKRLSSSSSSTSMDAPKRTTQPYLAQALVGEDPPEGIISVSHHSKPGPWLTILLRV